MRDRFHRDRVPSGLPPLGAGDTLPPPSPQTPGATLPPTHALTFIFTVCSFSEPLPLQELRKMLSPNFPRYIF